MYEYTIDRDSVFADLNRWVPNNQQCVCVCRCCGISHALRIDGQTILMWPVWRNIYIVFWSTKETCINTEMIPYVQYYNMYSICFWFLFTMYVSFVSYTMYMFLRDMDLQILFEFSVPNKIFMQYNGLCFFDLFPCHYRWILPKYIYCNQHYAHDWSG